MKKPIVMDIEASGLGKGSYPIEIGFVTSEGKCHCSLIKPIENWSHWAPDAEILHGIKRELLYEKGKDILYIAEWLNAQLANEVVYSDGWVNDMCWLGLLFNEAGIPQKFKIESILSLLTDFEREQWSVIHQRIIESSSLRRHRASSDALMIQQTFWEVKQGDGHSPTLTANIS